jgi:hypothetical protein
VVAAAVDVLCARPLHGVQTQRGAWVLALGQGTLRVLPAADGTRAVVHVPRGQPHRTVRRACPWTMPWEWRKTMPAASRRRCSLNLHAAWRQQPPTEQQLALLRKWCVPLPLALTRGMAADVLTAVMGDWE